jgi:hypothetical protein
MNSRIWLRKLSRKGTLSFPLPPGAPQIQPPEGWVDNLYTLGWRKCYKDPEDSSFWRTDVLTYYFSNESSSQISGYRETRIYWNLKRGRKLGNPDCLPESQESQDTPESFQEISLADLSGEDIYPALSQALNRKLWEERLVKSHLPSRLKDLSNRSLSNRSLSNMGLVFGPQHLYISRPKKKSRKSKLLQASFLTSLSSKRTPT